MQEISILGISGSLRDASWNTRLVRETARHCSGAALTLADINLPLYDGDVESRGLPPEVQTLAAQISAADAVLVATPEYNKGVSGALKNALDWVSRVDGNPWLGKPVAILSATAGRSGGERAQSMLRDCLLPFRPRLVMGPEVLIGGAASEFNAEDRIENPRYVTAMTGLMAELRAEVAAQA